MSKKIVKTKIDTTIEKKEFFITCEDLRAYIHTIHNFLRNNGVGYGKNGMMIFSLFYGLKLIQPILDTFNLDGDKKRLLDFNILLEKANKNDNTIDKYIDEEILGLLWELKTDEKYTSSQRGLGQFLFHQIPRGIKFEVWYELIKRIGCIPVGFKDGKVNLSGKVYEYFVGRDKTAISELGAFFTDRHITDFIFKKLNIMPDENGDVPTMADIFGGSGGFTLGYANHFRENFNINWKENVDNIYHFDMEETVVNMTGLEMFAITGYFPDRKNNYKRENSFTSEFIKDGKPMKFKFIISNPPYGGDKTERNAEQIRRDKMLAKIESIYKAVNEGIKDKAKHKKVSDNKMYKKIKEETKNYFEEQDKHHVNLKSCSPRIKAFAKKYNLDTANDKEACSLILLADLLDENGVCCAVLKEGVFFDGKYSKLRKIILENYNVTDVISITSDSFENTTTKTSIIIFQNNGKTKKVNFSELVVSCEEDDIFTEGNIDIMKLEDYCCSIEKNKGMIKDNGVNDKLICSATLEQISAPNITKKKGKENEKFNYSLNSKDYKNYVIDCPEGFELKTLGEYLNFRPKSKRPASYASEDGKYRFYTSSDKIKKCNECDFNDDELKIIFGDGGKGSLFIDNHFSCSDHNIICTTKNIYETYYIYDYIKNNWDDFIERMFNGSVLGNIGKERLNGCKIPFPKDITKLKPILDKLYALHQSIAQMTDSIPLKEKQICDTILKATDEGKESIDYTVVSFNDMVVYQSKIKKYKASAGKINGKYKFYTSSQDKILFIDDEPMFKENMLIMGRKGSVSIHYDTMFSCEHDDVYVMKINNNNTQYMKYYIKNNIEWFKNQMNGSVIKGTSKEILGKFNIKLLSPSQMKKLKLQALFDDVDTLKETLEQTKQEYQELTDELFKDFKKPDTMSENLQLDEETLSTEPLSDIDSEPEIVQEVKPKKSAKKITLEPSAKKESDTSKKGKKNTKTVTLDV